MKILVVEDDDNQAEWVVDLLQEAWPNLAVEVVNTERGFREGLPRFSEDPPNVILMDLMLRWDDPRPKTSDEPVPEDVVAAGTSVAGLRCIESLQGTESMGSVPVVLYTALSTSDLEGRLTPLPAHVHRLTKSSGSDDLIRLIGTLLASQAPTRTLLESSRRRERTSDARESSCSTEEPEEQPANAPETNLPRPASPRVFISYSQDSDDQCLRVRALSDRMRLDGIDCRIDQYIATPQLGWPLWMENEVENAQFVLVVFTNRYTRKAKSANRSGARFESVLILQELYEAGMLNQKFIPVLFDKLDTDHIAKWLRPYDYYLASTEDGYESLRRRLLDDPAVVMPPLGVPMRKGPNSY